jgi:hypothetical protein
MTVTRETLEIVSYPMGYRGLVLNGHREADGTMLATAAAKARWQDTIRVDRFDFSRLQIRDQREPLHLLSGADVGDATVAGRYLALGGSIVATTAGKLEDRIAEVFQAFHIEEAQVDAASTEGISPFTFTCPTELAGYSPRQIERFNVRPAGYPAIFERRSRGLETTFAVELFAPDARRYRDSADAIVLDAGNSFTAACPNWTLGVATHVPPLVTILLAGAGSGSFTLRRQPAAGIFGQVDFVMNLSGLGASTVTVDMATMRILVGNTPRADLQTSAVDTFWAIPRGGCTAEVLNTTGLTSVTLSYRQARA